MTAPGEVFEFAERIGAPMPPWQRERVAALFSGDFVLQADTRRNGRAACKRTLTEFAAFGGEHVHSVQHDGEWCVTRQGKIGYLYARIR